MDREAKVHNCSQCGYIRMYDHGRRIYYCDNEDRTDDMGKVGADDLPEIGPEWCPLRYGNGKNVESDLIEIKSDIQLTDRMGNPIEIKVPRPEYVSEIFS